MASQSSMELNKVGKRASRLPGDQHGRRTTHFRVLETRMSQRHRRYSKFAGSRKMSTVKKPSKLASYFGPKKEKLSGLFNSLKLRNKAIEEETRNENIEKLRQSLQTGEPEFSQVPAVSSAKSGDAKTNENKTQTGSTNSLVSRSQLLNQIDKITKVDD